MIMDKLYEKVEKRGVVCLGLDTAAAYVPEYMRCELGDAEAVLSFNKQIIDATSEIVACYKVQIAYYEAMGVEGLSVYKKTLEYIRKKGELVIADIKRGDIKDTAAMYAKAHFEGDFECDIVTLSPYMGMDSLEPYMPYFKDKDKGCFTLVRTSNPGARDIQYLQLNGGETVYERVGRMIQDAGNDFMGKHGYSAIGAVMGATNVEEIKRMREEMKNVFFLIPGYGAQGGRAEDIRMYLRGGNGGVVNSSRAILLKYKQYEDGERKFASYAEQEVMDMNKAISGKF